MKLINWIKELIRYSSKSKVIPYTGIWPGSYWLSVTFLSKREPESQYEYLFLINLFAKNPELLPKTLDSELYESKDLLNKFLSLIPENGMLDSIIKSIKYVISFIGNRSSILPNPDFDTEFDFWFHCQECGGKLLTNSPNWHQTWCTKSFLYLSKSLSDTQLSEISKAIDEEKSRRIALKPDENLEKSIIKTYKGYFAHMTFQRNAPKGEERSRPKMGFVRR